MTSSAKHSSDSRFAIETYYGVLEYINCKQELAKLARTAPALQLPSESRLYRTIVLKGERDLRAFRDLVTSPKTTRIGGLVRGISYEDNNRLGGTQENIGDDLELTLVKDVLGKLPALRELHIRIEDTVGWKTSQALGSLLSESLTVLHCSLDFNAPFVAFLRRQTQLRELHCECAFPEGIIPSSKWEKILVSTDDNMLPKSPQAVPTTRCRFLPNLRALRTNSHTLALGLISGRPMSHVWITESNAFISAPPKSPTYSSTTRRMTAGAPEPQPQFFSHESDTTLRETFWSDLFYKFAIVLASQTTCEAGTRSVRLDFEDVPQGVVADGLKNFAKWLGPTVRTLGFLNNAAVDELSTWSGKHDVEMFTHLHTIVLTYTPSLAVVENLAKSTALPALRTIACYGFSRRFEYLCIPVNDAKDVRGEPVISGSPQNDPSGWSHHTGDVEWALDLEGFRRATPVHDPDFMLWLDA